MFLRFVDVGVSVWFWLPIKENRQASQIWKAYRRPPLPRSLARAQHWTPVQCHTYHNATTYRSTLVALHYKPLARTYGRDVNVLSDPISHLLRCHLQSADTLTNVHKYHIIPNKLKYEAMCGNVGKQYNMHTWFSHSNTHSAVYTIPRFYCNSYHLLVQSVSHPVVNEHVGVDRPLGTSPLNWILSCGQSPLSKSILGRTKLILAGRASI